jgi:hypothetical protein
MATTTNYSWTTPDDTDLVKDGASAIRTLGSSIDTTTKNLNPSTTLGDIEYRSSTANTNTRLAIGTTGQVLTVSGGVPAWAAAPGGGADFTLINAGGTALTGAQTITVNVSGKNQIYIYIDRASSASASSFMRWRLNTDTGNNYYYFATGNDIAGYDGGGPANFIYAGRMGTSAGDSASGFILINGCDATGIKPFVSAGFGTGTSSRYYSNVGHYTGASAITSVSFNSETGNFDSGTMYVYGA